MNSPFPDPEPDNPGPEPTEPSWSGDEEDGGAYLGELMAAAAAGEELTAGDIAGAGFGQDGTAGHGRSLQASAAGTQQTPSHHSGMLLAPQRTISGFSWEKAITVVGSAGAERRSPARRPPDKPSGET